jgi:hypothetical protein
MPPPATWPPTSIDHSPEAVLADAGDWHREQM